MNRNASRPRVVVTGADLPTGLGIARSLRETGAEITGLCKDRRSLAARSRSWDRLVLMDAAAGPGEYLDTLRELGRSAGGPAVLFPTQDEIVQLVSERRDELERWFHFVLPSSETVETFLDKTKFHPWACDRGFPVPVSRVVSSRGELAAALDGIGYPLIVKPLYRTAAWQRNERHKVYRFGDRAEYDALGFDLFEDAPRFIVQRWIAGGDADVHFCLAYYSRDGEELGYYTGKKLLQWFPGTGSTAICVGTGNEEVHRSSREIFRAAGYRGLGSIEFKRDARDGKYYVTEPTVGRNNLQSYLATAGGVNLTRIAFEDALGQSPRQAAKRRKAIWIEEHFTLRALRAMTGSRALLVKEIFMALATGAAVSFAFFKFTDPWPFAALCWSLIFE